MAFDLEDQSWAFTQENPIRNPEQLVVRRPRVRKTDAKWYERTEHIWWATHYKNKLTKIQKETLVLRDKLLTFAGTEVCMHHGEADLKMLLRHGQIWHNTNFALMKGEECACHSNSSELWEQNQEEVRIATGYALSNDGMWRQHSWCLQKTKDKTQPIRVVETTSKRALYFGVVFNPAGCAKFSNDNLI